MDRGFTLIEVLVATLVMAVGTVALAQVSLQGVHANRDARSVTLASGLASRKLEQLRGLAWAFDASGAPVSDTSTDTTVYPEQPSGGTGLSPSPAGTLSGNVAGYCDFIDAGGRVLGGGTELPSGTAFVRRWSIAALQPAGIETLVIQVSVTPVWARPGGAPSAVRPLRDEIRLLVVKSRKGS